MEWIWSIWRTGIISVEFLIKILDSGRAARAMVMKYMKSSNHDFRNNSIYINESN